METTMPDLEKIWSHHPGITPVAFIYGDQDCSGPYRVSSISIGGVVLSGRSPLQMNAEVQVLLLAPGQRQVTIEGYNDGLKNPTHARQFTATTSISPMLEQPPAKQCHLVCLQGFLP